MNMKPRLMLVLTIGLLASASAFSQSADVAMDLARKSGCLACHGLDNKLVGPSWRDVGKKYAGVADAEDKLVAKVRKGGKGVWGEVPMPPNVTVKEADVRTLVQYVLTLK
jgi:cytochrome c